MSSHRHPRRPDPAGAQRCGGRRSGCEDEHVSHTTELLTWSANAFHSGPTLTGLRCGARSNSSPTTPPPRPLLREGLRVKIPSPPSKPPDATSGIIKNQRVEPCLPRPPHRSRTGIPQRTPQRRSGLWELLHSLPCRICHCCPAVNRRIISVSSALLPSHRDVAGSP